MKKLMAKKWVAWLLVLVMLFAESGVVQAAGSPVISNMDAVTAEATSDISGDLLVEIPVDEFVFAAGTEDGADVDVTCGDVTAGDSTDDVTDGDASDDDVTDGNVSDEDVTNGDASNEDVAEDVAVGDMSGLSVDNVAANGELFAVGSDGIVYSGVAYLSATTVAGLDQASRQAYLDTCNSIAEEKNAGVDIENAVFYLNDKGELSFSYHVPAVGFGATEKASDVKDVKVATGVVIATQEDAAKWLSDKNGIAVLGKDTAKQISDENRELAKLNEIAEEVIEPVEGEIFGTYYNDENYFRKQIKSSEVRDMYDAAKNKMVKGSSNSFSFHSDSFTSSGDISTAVAAIQNAYPLKFDWADRKEGWTGEYTYSLFGGGYSYKITVPKSKHYSKSLVTKAQKKANELVEEAYEFSAKNYPNSPTYGMLYYFDKWICENNYYNDIGLGETEADMKTKEFYYCHSSIGILLMGYGVCESYALAMSRLMDIAGIPNMTVYGHSSGAGHAWNCVQMPDGNWYMLDSTWNDGGSSSNRKWLLSAKDSGHTATGARYSPQSQNFNYPGLSGSKYSASSENLDITLSAAAILKGKKATASIPDYYKRFKKTWSSGDTKIVKIDQKGKITGAAPGQTTINCMIAGKTFTKNIIVAQWSGLTFEANGKANYSHSFGNADSVFNASDLQTIVINVGQKNGAVTAAKLKELLALEDPVATTANKNIATVASCTLSGDTITLKVQPQAVGSTKITVKFAGKKATLSFRAAQKMQDGWFGALDIATTEYTGKAIKPKVTKTAAAPKDLKYKVVYVNNTNAGTATVNIEGLGKYGGTVTRTFQITQRDFTLAEFKNCSASAVYNGKELPAKTTVKWKGKALKAGKDYVVLYNNKTTVPVDAGTYTVTVQGLGNYTKKNLATSFTYTINKAPVTKLKITCPSTVKYSNGANVTPEVTVKIGKTVISNANYTITWQNADGQTVNALTAKGKYTLTLTPKGNVEATAKKAVLTKKVTVK